MMSQMGSMNNQIADAEEGYTEQMRALRRLWLAVAWQAVMESRIKVQAVKKWAYSKSGLGRVITVIEREMRYYKSKDCDLVMVCADVYFSEEQIRKCLTPKSLGGAL